MPGPGSVGAWSGVPRPRRLAGLPRPGRGDGGRTRFWEARGRIPDRFLEPWEIASLRSWLAARSSDRQAETTGADAGGRAQALEASALERLAVLAVEAGDPKEAERLQRQKAEIDRAKDQHPQARRPADRLPVPRRENSPGSVGQSGSATSTHTPGPWWRRRTRRLPSHALPPAGAARESQCRTASDAAMARLLASEEESLQPEATLADRLAGPARPCLAFDRGDVAARPSDMRPASARLQFVDDAEAAGLRFVFDNGRTPMYAPPRDALGRRGPDRFRRRRLARRLLRPGRIVRLASDAARLRPGIRPRSRAGRPALPQPAGRDISRRHPAGRDRPPRRGRGYGMGVAVGDYDNDGHPDLFLTRLAPL